MLFAIENDSAQTKQHYEILFVLFLFDVFVDVLTVTLMDGRHLFLMKVM